jgi:hypothetical protein
MRSSKATTGGIYFVMLSERRCRKLENMEVLMDFINFCFHEWENEESLTACPVNLRSSSESFAFKE